MRVGGGEDAGEDRARAGDGAGDQTTRYYIRHGPCRKKKKSHDNKADKTGAGPRHSKAHHTIAHGAKHAKHAARSGGGRPIMALVTSCVDRRAGP